MADEEIARVEGSLDEVDQVEGLQEVVAEILDTDCRYNYLDSDLAENLAHMTVVVVNHRIGQQSGQESEKRLWDHHTESVASRHHTVLAPGKAVVRMALIGSLALVAGCTDSDPEDLAVPIDSLVAAIDYIALALADQMLWTDSLVIEIDRTEPDPVLGQEGVEEMSADLLAGYILAVSQPLGHRT